MWGYRSVILRCKCMGGMGGLGGMGASFFYT